MPILYAEGFTTAPPAPPLALYYAPPSDLPVRLEAPAAGSSRPRTMQRAIMRPVDLSATHGFNLVRANLDRMVSTYRMEYEAAGINFDHEWGGPGHGWCTRLWMGEGDLLWSEWNQMTDEAVEGILSGQWPRCSAEFWLSHPVLKDWYFTGLALLGAKGPAVPGLPAPILMQRPIYRLIQLEAEPPAGASPTTESNRSGSTEPTAPVSGEPKENDMTEKAKTPAGAAAGTPENPTPAAPAATTETPAPAATPAAPDTVSLEAQRATLAATTAQVNATLATAQATLAAAKRDRAEIDVEKKLDALGKRLSPGMRKLARPLLVELSASVEPMSVKLSAGDGKPAADVAVAEQLLAVLAACPDLSSNFSQLAGAETDPQPVNLSEVDSRNGITPERAAELSRKFPGSFAPQAN